MADSGKRKSAPASGGGGQPVKKKKAGSKGKWQTPHQKGKLAQAQPSGQVQAGDVGLWATCVRGQESRAARELAALLDEYGESMYGVKQQVDENAGKGQEGNQGGNEGGQEKEEEDEEEEDIESAIRREVAALKAREKNGDLAAPRQQQQHPSSAEPSSSSPLFKVIRVGNLDCLLFARARVPGPVEPVALVRRICADARACADPRRRKSRLLSRLSPVSASGKATEQGMAEAAARALGGVFVLSSAAAAAAASTATATAAATAAVRGGKGGEEEERKEERNEKEDGEGGEEGEEGEWRRTEESKDTGAENREDEKEITGVSEKSGGDAQGAVGAGAGVEATGLIPPSEQKSYTFAIRPTIRNNNMISRDAVIKQVAGIIDGERHKVNLGSPDKVILVEIFQTVCGFSVVDGSDWEALKKFNISELYSPSQPKQLGEGGIAPRVNASVAK